MNRFAYLVKSINILNLLLTITLALAVYHIIVPFFESDIPVTLPAVQRTAEAPEKPPPSQPKPSFPDYLVISEKNLFHEERKIPSEQKEVTEKGVVPPPDFILYGTLIAGDQSVAYLEDMRAPYSTPGRERRQRQFKKGDNVSGYILKEIAPTRVILVNDEDTLTITLDARDRKRGGAPAVPPSYARPPGSELPFPAVMPAVPPLQVTK
jgi:hypothetical protein